MTPAPSPKGPEMEDDVEMSALMESEVVGPWKPPIGPVFICPPPPSTSWPCDCGFDGEWERREVYVWNDKPGHRRGDKTARRDLARGLPARVDDEGWWVMAGYDERCPGCGDIERFTHEAERMSTLIETAHVVSFLRPSPKGTHR